MNLFTSISFPTQFELELVMDEKILVTPVCVPSGDPLLSLTSLPLGTSLIPLRFGSTPTLPLGISVAPSGLISTTGSTNFREYGS